MRSTLRSMALLILIFLGAFTGTALAATADPNSAPELARSIFDAVMHSQWWAVAAYGVILACIGVRRFLPDSWKTGVKGDVIGTSVAFAIAFAGAIAMWAVAPGATMTMAVLATATKIGVTAVGGYTVIHKLLGWLAAWGKLPPWMSPILTLLGAMVGSNAIATAEAAGAAAVAVTPAPGMTGDSTIHEVE